MSEEPKPVRCGCGGKADSHMSFTYEYYVMCHMCGTRTDYYIKEAEAVEAWNRAMGTSTRRLLEVLVHDATDTNVGDDERTAKVEKVDMPSEHNKVYKCSECGQYMHRTSWSSPVNYCTNCGARLEWE